MADIKRVNVNVPVHLHEWFKEESERTGLTVNALMMVALNNYYKEQMVLPNIPKMMEFIKAMEHMQGGKSS